jgi:hypothetical protein
LTTRVGRCAVPIRGGRVPTLAHFTGGRRGPREHGIYAFWTALLTRRVDRQRSIIVRALSVLPPGERFERMRREARTARTAGERQAYRELWRRVLHAGRNIKAIRPANRGEVSRWLETHPEDAACVRWFHDVEGSR